MKRKLGPEAYFLTVHLTPRLVFEPEGGRPQSLVIFELFASHVFLLSLPLLISWSPRLLIYASGGGKTRR
jgi:hypothetical protein